MQRISPASHPTAGLTPGELIDESEAAVMATGSQAAEIAAVNHGDVQYGALEPTRHTNGLHSARVAVNRAREQLNHYALTTNDPGPGAVEAADLLDAAATYLAQACQFPFGACRPKGAE